MRPMTPPIHIPHLSSTLTRTGAAATFYLYALVLLFGIYFIYTRVPETKGLTLEEIEDFFLRASRYPPFSFTNLP